MKIAIITEIFPPIHGGAAVAVETLAKGLHDHGEQVIALTNNRGAEGDGQYPFRVYRSRSTPVPRSKDYKVSVAPRRFVWHHLDEFAPDCLHFHTSWGPLHSAAYAWAKRHDIPVVVTNHVMAENNLQQLAYLGPLARPVSEAIVRRERRLINQCALLAAPTETALRLTSNGIAIPKVAISNGIDTDYYSPGKPSKDHGKYIFSIGRLTYEKRLDLALEAFAKARKACPDMKFFIAGKGPLLEELKAQAERLNIQDSVEFLGRISDEEKRDWLRGDAMYINACPVELQCIVALESLSCNTPAILADQGALVELIDEGKNGYLFAYPDTDDLAEKMIRLWQEPIAPEVLRESARNMIIKKHDVKEVVRQYLALYRRAISNEQYGKI